MSICVCFLRYVLIAIVKLSFSGVGGGYSDILHLLYSLHLCFAPWVFYTFFICILVYLTFYSFQKQAAKFKTPADVVKHKVIGKTEKLEYGGVRGVTILIFVLPFIVYTINLFCGKVRLRNKRFIKQKCPVFILSHTQRTHRAIVSNSFHLVSTNIIYYRYHLKAHMV